MTINTPVLSVKCGGPDEILLNGKYGMVVESNEESIYKGIIKLIDDVALYNKYLSVDKEILNEFKMSKVIGKLNKLLAN